MNAFLKATILGGVLFLLPLAIVLMLLGYALRLAGKLAQPISDRAKQRVLPDNAVTLFGPRIVAGTRVPA